MESDENNCPYRKACYVIAVVVILLILLWGTGYLSVSMSKASESLTDNQITNVLIHRALTEDPQNSAAVMRTLSSQERQKYMERMTGLPYDPLYYSGK
jgi:hypothetical protein